MEEKKLEIVIKAVIINDDYGRAYEFERELFREIENHFLNSMSDWLTVTNLEISSSSGRRLKKEGNN